MFALFPQCFRWLDPLLAGVLMVIFGGDFGHKAEVLSLDIHVLGNCFVSGSMDTSIKVRVGVMGLVCCDDEHCVFNAILSVLN